MTATHAFPARRPGRTTGSPEDRPPTSAPPVRTALGLLLALGAAAAMGSAVAALKLMDSTDLSAVNVVQARATVGAVALMTLALLLRRGRVRIGRPDRWLVGAYGVLSLAVNYVVFTMSLSRLSVGIALLVEYLAPLLVALWVRVVRGQRVSALVWVGMTVTLLGLALVARVSAEAGLDGLGLLLGLLAAATMASRFLLTERALRRHDALVLAAWGTTTAAVALLLTLPLDPFPTDALASRVDAHHTDLPMAVLVLWVGVVGSAGGVLLSVAAQRVLAPTSVSLVLTLEVVAGAGLAYLFLDEALTGPQVVGGAVMLAGIAVAQVAGARRPAPTRRAGAPRARPTDRGR